MARNIIPTAPGGNQLSRDADKNRVMDAYVHLCFCRNHPMEHIAKQDGRISDSIFLEINLAIIKLPNILISNDVSNKTGVNCKAASDMLEELDLEVIYTRTDWNDSAIKMRLQAAEKYELLIPNHVGLEFMMNLNNG